MTSKRAAMVALWFCVSLAGCGDDDAGGGNTDGGQTQCIDLSGTWTVDEHCGGAAVVGMTVPVTQTGCAFTTGGTFAGFAGTIDESGAITLSGVANNQQIDCTGTATATRITETCTGDCNVVMTK